MDPKTIKKLLAINQEFYAGFSQEFAASRSVADQTITCLEPVVQKWHSLVDLGCGNGRLAAYLDRKKKKREYLGLDQEPRLIRIASKRNYRYLKASFQVTDIAYPGWSLKLKPGYYDGAVALAVFHHLPSFNLRLRVLLEAKKLLRPGGKLVVSAWQFLDSPRLKKKVVPWREVGLTNKDVEAGDYLLSWQRGGVGWRYCHLLSEEELKKMITKAGFRLTKVWRAGGREGNLSLYGLLTPDII